ncbi:MAG: DinB family protein [Bacteroidetes bacterium]|nr:DinB family protein [Bacteroidota bacterium]
MIIKEDLISMFQKEFATTLKVMRAYPETQMQFAPHERSSPAKRLMATFVFEMYLLRSFIFGETVDRSAFQQYAKETLDELIADFEKETTKVIQLMKNLNENDLSKKVEFAGTTFTADRFAMMMLFDQVHHRGQLSVYIRMAGGKVPSIYGPSADDTSTNL